MFDNTNGMVMNWLMILIFIFVTGILFTVYLYAFQAHFIPVISGINNMTTQNTTLRDRINADTDKYLSFFKFLPFVLLFAVILYGISNAIYNQSNGGTR